MKQIYNILNIAALVLAGAMTIGCDSLKEELELPTPESTLEKTITVTSTVGLDVSTKALTAAGVKTFAADETIAVFYTNESSELVKTTYTFTAGDLIDGGRRATITVSMTEPLAGGAVKYIYPATMANATARSNIPPSIRRMVPWRVLQPLWTWPPTKVPWLTALPCPRA